MIQKHLLTALVKNKAGVLTRISGLFARRGYNIESLVVCTTEKKEYSRITMVVSASEDGVKQIIKQLEKLIDTKRVLLLSSSQEDTVARELLMLKVKAAPKQRSEIETACSIYKAEIIDLSPNSMVIELTGKSAKLDAFIELVRPYEIIELARTGITALQRGSSNIYS